MPHLIPFSVISHSINLGSPPYNGEQRIPVTDFLNAVRTVIRAVPVDELWYCETYPDVRQAIEAGDITSAQQHFVENGYFEGRRPGPSKVDERWYLATYPDVEEGIEAGDFASAHDHFDRHGCREGRVPTKADLVAATG
jgi:hypothetical protein